jgi:hypothetical protein
LEQDESLREGRHAIPLFIKGHKTQGIFLMFSIALEAMVDAV